MFGAIDLYDIAVGSLFLTPTYLSLPIVSRYSALLANPFSLTVVTSSLGILLSTMVVPPYALRSLLKSITNTSAGPRSTPSTP